MNRLLRSFWSEPRPVAVPRNRSDWRLLAALVAIALLEVLLRDDLELGSPSFVLGLALMPAVLWRRSHPLWMTGLVFTVIGVFEGAGLVTGQNVPDLHALAFVLILPYALFRWGSGREALLGLPIFVGSGLLGLARDKLSVSEFLGGLVFLIAPIAIGTAVRYRVAARVQELEDVRAGERLRLARELHDSVAHHVSAIAVRAQAGIATSAQDSEAAVEALRVIAGEASRTLSEMREMVRVLRDDEAAELAPAPRVEDLEAHFDQSGPIRVEIELSGETAKLSPALSGAVYRLAQESITNAHRHARGATRICVEVAVDESTARLHVEDDGEPTSAGANSGGYGLIGMAERVQLLGGTLQAGPGTKRGWTVTAVFPRGGVGTTA